jgi:hypothetical protein
VFFRINEIRDVINTRAKHRSRAITLALYAPLIKYGRSRFSLG